jgi:hypothetical protein
MRLIKADSIEEAERMLSDASIQETPKSVGRLAIEMHLQHRGRQRYLFPLSF